MAGDFEVFQEQHDCSSLLPTMESNMSTLTPNMEYSPPISPRQSNSDVKDARSCAKVKLVLLSLDEKVGRN
jgi:hypothetical protein